MCTFSTLDTVWWHNFRAYTRMLLPLAPEGEVTLVSPNLQPVSRELLDFLGLDRDDRCRQFPEEPHSRAGEGKCAVSIKEPLSPFA